MKQSLFDLAGRRALITGSSRGIGLAIARGLGEAGATVILNGRSTDDLEAARGKLADAGIKVHAVAFDVTDQAAIETAIDAIERDVGPIDILFNNAGIQRRMPFVEIPAETWREVLSVNLDSVFFMSQAVAKRMIPRGRGKIVNTCSLMSEQARATIAPYTAAKGAVKMLTKSMCVEWAKHGIQANGIGPGFIRTEMNVALTTNKEFDAWVRGRTPAGRWGEVDELVGAAHFLASDASNFVNGQILYVDGGVLASIG
ncbi:MAG: SDR family oxidoreductase [Bauldia sp.]